jgi:hypothetical protein
MKSTNPTFHQCGLSIDETSNKCHPPLWLTSKIPEEPYPTLLSWVPEGMGVVPEGTVHIMLTGRWLRSHAIPGTCLEAAVQVSIPLFR